MSFSDNFKTFNRKGSATMKNRKSLIVIVAAIMLISFAAVPPANAFITTATLTLILAVTYVSSVFIAHNVIKPDDESKTEHSESKKKTQDNLQALNAP